MKGSGREQAAINQPRFHSINQPHFHAINQPRFHSKCVRKAIQPWNNRGKGNDHTIVQWSLRL